MENSNGWASFPIIYSDGEREYNMGNIEIYSTLSYKIFQQVMSQRIGLNPNQMLIYLVRMSSCPEYQPRIPVTGKVKFQFIVHQRNCYFYVIPKKSSSSRPSDLGFRANKLDSYSNNKESQTPADNYPVRNQAGVDLSSVSYSGYQLPNRNLQTDMSMLNDRFQKLAMEREKLQKAMAGPPIDIRESDPDLGPGFIVKKNQEEVFCEECAKAKQDDEAVNFHFCVNDKVIKWFKTTAGPIAPPPPKTFILRD